MKLILLSIDQFLAYVYQHNFVFQIPCVKTLVSQCFF